MNPNTLQQKRLLPTDQGSSQPIPTILIGRNSLVRAGVCHILDGTPFVVAGEFEDSSQLPATLIAPPTLCIISESHPTDALVGIVAGLKAQSPSARVVVFADHLNPKTILQLLQAGMDGLCSPRMDREALLKALALVMLGETFIPVALALMGFDKVSHAHKDEPDMTPALTPADETAMREHNLSSREVEILRHLTEGESNKVIARKLDITEATIKVHVKTILRKLQAANRTQAAIWAVAHLNAASDSRHLPSSDTGRV
jgi:two-component system nitrate/nitrite response regulator NarL